MVSIANIKKLLTKSCKVGGITLPDGRICFNVNGHIAIRMDKDPAILARLMDIHAINANEEWGNQVNVPSVFTPKPGQNAYAISNLSYKVRQDACSIIYNGIDTKLVKQNFIHCCGAGVLTSTNDSWPVYYAEEIGAEPEVAIMPVKITIETAQKLSELLLNIKEGYDIT